jgi:murein DD-endopeptidase MepM/ murein hydrolase activator NlpD
MAGSTAEIIARLTLNGGQFSSETARVFAQMETQARDTAAQTRTAFEGSFQQIQQMASKALSAPRTGGGALDLNVAGYKEAAAAAQAHAVALREIANAADRAGASSKMAPATEQTRLYQQAARAAAVEAENLARAAIAEANAMDLLQNELNQTKSATDLVVQGNRVLTQSQDRAATAARGHNMAMVQGSQQVQDFFIQVGGGQNIMAAFAMQASQMAFVLQGVGGSAGKVAGFLSGPWGAAVLGGMTLLTLFGDKLFDTTSALEKETKALEKNQQKSLAAEEAKRAFAKTAPGVIETLRSITAEIERQNLSLDENIRLQQKQLEGGVNIVTGDRNKKQEELAKAKRELEDARRNRDNTGNAGSGAEAAAVLATAETRFQTAQAKVKKLEADIARINTVVAEAERAARMAEFPLIERRAKEATDRSAAIEGQFRRELEIERERRAQNKITADELLRREINIQNRRKAALEEEAKLRKEARGRGPDGDLTTFGWPVRGPQTGKFNEQRVGRRHAGVDIAVPVGTKVEATAAGTIIESGTLPGYGNVIIIDHGRGTTTRYAHLSKLIAPEGSFVEKGQVIGLSGGAKGAPGAGNSRGPHVHYEVRQNGRAVDPGKGQFATDTLAVQEQAEDAQAKLAKQKAEEEERALAAMNQQVDAAAQLFRFDTMRLQGQEREAELAADIARLWSGAADDMAKLPEEQQKVSEAVDQQLAGLHGQADVLAGLIEAHGDRKTLTDAEKAAEQQAVELIQVELNAALALATTAAERLSIQEAMLRVQHQLNNAADDAQKTADRDKKNAEEMERFREEQAKEWKAYLDDQAEAARETFDSVAGFWEDAFRSGGKSIWDDFEDLGFKTLGRLAAQWTMQLLSGQGGAAGGGGILGQLGAFSGASSGGFPIGLFGGGGGISGAARGAPGGGIGGGVPFVEFGGGFGGPVHQSAAAAAGSPGGGIGPVAGQIGQALPMFAAAMMASSAVSGMLGIKNHAGGMFGVAGNLLINAVTPAKRGSATLGFNQYGELGVTSTRGNSKKRIGAASDAGGSIADTLEQIADALGGKVGGSASVSIGMRDKSWRVDTTGRGKTKTKDGAKDFGEDQEAAIRYAIGDALKDGVIAGISDASKKILASGQQLERAIEKAVLIESIPKRLAARLDPVGAAIDDLNKKWKETVDALREGGASAEQMADAQKLYKLELEETKSSARAASAELRDFLDNLNFGSASPYSLDQQGDMARAALQPFLDKIASGESFDQGKWQEVAASFLEIERELYGSTGKFFESMDMIQAATGKAISTIDNAKPIRSVSDPFAEATAGNTGAMASILEQMNETLPARIAEALLSRMQGGGGGFVGVKARLFADEATGT